MLVAPDFCVIHLRQLVDQPPAWKYTGVNRVAKALNGWQRQIDRRHQRHWAYVNVFPLSILRTLRFLQIWYTACRTVTCGSRNLCAFVVPTTLGGSTALPEPSEPRQPDRQQEKEILTCHTAA